VAIKHLDGGIMYKLLGLKSLKEYIVFFKENNELYDSVSVLLLPSE